jgi:hypothetical protein
VSDGRFSASDARSRVEDVGVGLTKTVRTPGGDALSAILEAAEAGVLPEGGGPGGFGGPRGHRPG